MANVGRRPLAWIKFAETKDSGIGLVARQWAWEGALVDCGPGPTSNTVDVERLGWRINQRRKARQPDQFLSPFANRLVNPLFFIDLAETS